MYKLHKVLKEMYSQFVILKQNEACGVNSLLNITFFVRRTVTGGSRIHSGFLPVNARLPVNAHLIFLCWRSRTNASISLLNGRSQVFPVCGENG